MSSPALAIVTGASSGIGAAFASALAARGHRVLAVARRADRLDELARAAPPDAVVALPLDLTAAGAVDAVVRRARELGPVDLLVSAAGRGAHGRGWEIPRSTTAQVLALNVTAGVDLVTALLPDMVARGRGGLVVVTSAGGFYPSPYLAAYGASKAFLLSYAEALSAELRGTGVRVMALCPGPVSTEFGEIAGMADLMEGAPGTMRPEEVAASALRAFAAGRTVHVPGAVTAVMSGVLARLPRAATRRVAERLFRR
ncbi:SDR family NAD(P)-dependent oxidoreductase [Pseudonocardia lacus]|uniref:SDR family NAD(P)-dependent oxidoreductase n=1 Tax=Pseudonocardia lacus TaxID=2835865 RepID=UPI001BDD5FF1|nr:SDR family NAD(P)-dependent oxidoreductase [Pseudonocardia lacus]